MIRKHELQDLTKEELDYTLKGCQICLNKPYFDMVHFRSLKRRSLVRLFSEMKTNTSVVSTSTEMALITSAETKFLSAIK